MPHGIHNTSGVLIRGEGMDREQMKRYVLFSSQNILVIKTCHPAPFSLIRILSPPILYRKDHKKGWNFEILNARKVTRTWDTDKRSHMVKAKSENILEKTSYFLLTQRELRILIL